MKKLLIKYFFLLSLIRIESNSTGKGEKKISLAEIKEPAVLSFKKNKPSGAQEELKKQPSRSKEKMQKQPSLANKRM